MFLQNKLSYKALCNFKEFKDVTSKPYVKTDEWWRIREECKNLNKPLLLSRWRQKKKKKKKKKKKQLYSKPQRRPEETHDSAVIVILGENDSIGDNCV